MYLVAALILQVLELFDAELHKLCESIRITATYSDHNEMCRLLATCKLAVHPFVARHLEQDEETKREILSKGFSGRSIDALLRYALDYFTLKCGQPSQIDNFRSTARAGTRWASYGDEVANLAQAYFSWLSGYIHR